MVFFVMVIQSKIIELEQKKSFISFIYRHEQQKSTSNNNSSKRDQLTLKIFIQQYNTTPNTFDLSRA